MERVQSALGYNGQTQLEFLEERNKHSGLGYYMNR